MSPATAGAAVALLLAAALLLAGGSGRRSAQHGDDASARTRTPLRARVSAPVRRLRPPPPPPAPDLAVLLELTAVAVGAGLPPGRALREAVQAAPGAVPADLARVCAQLDGGADAERAWQGASQRWRPLADPLLLSARTGASTASLLVSAAAQHRAERRRAGAEAAARLGSQLVLPLGLCTLPAFLLLGVVPVVLTLARDVLAG
ncbi:type II secretion system F family protein [Kineococcus arenarius]|uniref:type II secretion system F family protein n=1 Tax=Kineococcus sp. SYSU DK007 TaxID=3383128 RepID=UPI003D7E6ED3